MGEVGVAGSRARGGRSARAPRPLGRVDADGDGPQALEPLEEPGPVAGDAVVRLGPRDQPRACARSAPRRPRTACSRRCRCRRPPGPGPWAQPSRPGTGSGSVRRRARRARRRPQGAAMLTSRTPQRCHVGELAAGDEADHVAPLRQEQRSRDRHRAHLAPLPGRPGGERPRVLPVHEEAHLVDLHVEEAEAQHPVALLLGGLVEDLLGVRAVGAAVAQAAPRTAARGAGRDSGEG